MRRLASLLIISAFPAWAHVDTALESHILPAINGFATATQTLSEVAASDCTQDSVKPAYHAAFDAWLGVSHLAFGPIEAEGRALAIAFWPDTRGVVPKTVAAMIRDEDTAVADRDSFAQVSIAGRGLFAMEQVLFVENPYIAGSYSCSYVQALALDLEATAAGIAVEWPAQAALMRSAGEEGNAVYLSENEAVTELYTALLTGLEFNKDKRLGRPLGTFDRPRPKRAEAWRSGRSLRNVRLSLEALQGLALGLAKAEDMPLTMAAFAHAQDLADDLQDPVFADVSDISGRLKVEILQQQVQIIADAVALEIGAPLGLAAGFNSADGD